MNKELVLKGIKAAIEGNTIEGTLDQELFRILKEQTFLSMFYPVLKSPYLKKYYISSMLVNEEFNKIGSLITDLLSKKNIKHVFFKGYVVKKLYPQEYYRQSGDIDFYVAKEDFQETKKILLENGFVFIERCEHHDEYKYNNITVELHASLLDKTTLGYDFFVDCDKHLKHLDKCAYTLEDTYHLLFVIVHYARHLIQGAGLREVIDVYLMLRKYDIDMDYLNNSLKKLKLEEFFNALLNEIDVIFNYHEIPYKKCDIDELIDYCLKSGIHGYGKGNDPIANQVEHDKAKNKFTFLLKKLFIPVSALFRYYPWTKSIILIPFGYVYRFFKLLFSQSWKLKRVIKHKDQNDTLFNKIGL